MNLKCEKRIVLKRKNASNEMESDEHARCASQMGDNSRLRRRFGTAGLASGLSSSHFDGFVWLGWFERVGWVGGDGKCRGWMAMLLMDEERKEATGAVMRTWAGLSSAG